MKPYYFPNVHVEKSIKVEALKKKPSFFQPIGFDEKGNLTINLKDNLLYDDESICNNNKIKQIEEDAYNKGFKKGENDGIEALRDRIEPVLCSLRSAVIEIDKLKKNLLLNAEREAVELSLAVAKKIVCHEVSINRNVVINVVKEAAKKVVECKKIKLKLSPSDASFINEAKKNIPEFHDSLMGFLLEEDKTIMPGGCLIETDLGDIDARIDKQLQRVDEIFKAEIDKHGRY